jgi:large subunit ribosomal protein L24
MHVKKNDMVVILSGEEKGKVGKVLHVYPEKGRVLIEGVNVMSKAMRKSQDNPKGGVTTKEFPIGAAKVMLHEKFEARKKKRGVVATQE